MRTLWLILAVLGFALPNYFVLLESIQHGNILLWAHPMDTLSDMFANRIASIFALDLLWAVMVFFVWSGYEARQLQRPSLYWIWPITLIFGLAGSFPLYLYWRTKDLT